MGGTIQQAEIDKIYTKDDFIAGSSPYEEVYALKSNPFEFDRARERMALIAKSCGVGNFKSLFKSYCETMAMVSGKNLSGNASNFEGQVMELNTGQWFADDSGVTRINRGGYEEVACCHPIMPVQRFIDIDTGMEKIVIAYKKGGSWRSLMCDKSKIASANKIVDLASKGVAVTSENAKILVQYLYDVENMNYDRIPENYSVERMGWISDEFFSPYVDGIVYDGSDGYKSVYDSITEKGKADKWIEFVKKIRAEGNVPTKMVLAASFASVLVKPCNCRPFFIHLWNGSGNGKTVALMLAASVWANPIIGKFIHTFNSTAVGQEQLAGFLNSLPLIMDELQIQKDSRKDFDNMIYQLSEGSGRTRGAKEGGVRAVQTWQNCILTNGEQPITSANSGGGAINRIVEINTQGVSFFSDAKEVADFVAGNYGHVGKMFVERLMDPEIMKAARESQGTFFEQMFKDGITEKQALAASLILTADALMDLLIFNDGNGLSLSDVKQFLSTHSEISVGKRAYDFLLEWVVQNSKKFVESQVNNNETWGKSDLGIVRIVRNIFDKACSENGFNPTTVLSYLKQNNLIETEGKGYTKRVRLNGIKCQCVVLKTEEDILEHFQEIPKEEQIEF